MALEETAGNGEIDLEIPLDQVEELEENKLESPDEEEGEEVVITIGEEAPPTEEAEREQAPQWVKDLRKKAREDQRRIRELEAKLNAVSGVENLPPALGKKPQIGDDGIDYDPDIFEQKLEEWHEKKREVDRLERQKQEEAEKANQAWQLKLDAYAKAKSELKVPDFEDAEQEVMTTFSKLQQGIIIKASKDVAATVYALGKNTAKAKELASITDPVDFAAAIGELRGQIKVSSRKTPPPPERTVTGSAAPSGIAEKNLERLREEAAKTGDYSKVHAYKQQLKARK